MIACPKCGSDSQVVETRAKKRRRACKSVSCGAKFSTVEVMASDVKLAVTLLGGWP